MQVINPSIQLSSYHKKGVTKKKGIRAISGKLNLIFKLYINLLLDLECFFFIHFSFVPESGSNHLHQRKLSGLAFNIFIPLEYTNPQVFMAIYSEV